MRLWSHADRWQAGGPGVGAWLRRVATSDKAVRQLLLTEPVDRLEARAMLERMNNKVERRFVLGGVSAGRGLCFPPCLFGASSPIGRGGSPAPSTDRPDPDPTPRPIPPSERSTR